MRHNNISIFIPNYGCKQRCSFCDQHTIASTIAPPSFDEVEAIAKKAFEEIEDKRNTEIAFFGGSFTAIPHEMMLGYLNAVKNFVGESGFAGIRISTRPDAIDEGVLEILKNCNVTSIELGAQSMDDTVLTANNRGHDENAVIKASKLIKNAGFSLGLQMMVGLYKSDFEKDLKTAEKIILIRPDTVRIYPTVILKGTMLEKLLLSGEYTTMELDDAIKLCARLLLMFSENDISVIKLGLHASNEVEAQMVGGIYHPAFKELCENEIFLQGVTKGLRKIKGNKVTVYVAPTSVSKLVGQNRKNITMLEGLGYNISVIQKKGLDKYEVIVEGGVTSCS